MSRSRSTKKGRKSAGGRRFIPPTAHEALSQRLPGLAEVIRAAADKARRAPHWGQASIITPEAVGEIPEVQEFLRFHALEKFQRYGLSADEALDDADMLGNHIFYILNLELHYRKLFWVDESLAWMLDRTRLDIEGSYLQLPFSSFAFVFTDPLVLDLCHALTEIDIGLEDAHRKPKIVTVYLICAPLTDEVRAVHVRILIDRTLPDRWPYLIARDLQVRPKDHLDTILDSHFPEVNKANLDPFFSDAKLKRLLHLVVNAILYATTAHLDAVVVHSPLRGLKARMTATGPAKVGRLARRTARFSAEDVYHLPGKIPISQLVRLRDLEKDQDGQGLMMRFMVRGHWRRAEPNWKDQRLRWIEPYWKGPDLAAIIEREYQMKP